VSTILLAEDDPDVSLLLRTLLTSLGHETVLCRTGAEVLARWRENDPDLFVLDVNLPGDLDGRQITRTLRDQDVTTPVLMLTARGREEERAAGLASGADDYLVKPFELEVLIARVSALLDPAAPS
jgi:DNA-binding response OmpR family regulator